jgi:hypothetical protein
MQVGVAYAACEHLEQNLTGCGHGHRKLFQLQWVGIDGSRRPENGCTHRIPLSGWMITTPACPNAECLLRRRELILQEKTSRKG